MEWRPSPSPCTSATHASADSTSPKAANAATTGCRGRSSSRGTGSSCSSSTGKHDASATWHSISGRPPARNTLSGKHSRQAPGASSARRHDDRTDAAADDEPAATAGRHDAQSSAFSSAAGHYSAATAAGETLLHAAIVNNCQDYPIFLPGKLSETKLFDLRLKFNFKHPAGSTRSVGLVSENSPVPLLSQLKAILAVILHQQRETSCSSDQNNFAGIAAAAAASSPTATDAGNASAPGAHGWPRGHTQFASPPAWARHDAGC